MATYSLARTYNDGKYQNGNGSVLLGEVMKRIITYRANGYDYYDIILSTYFNPIPIFLMEQTVSITKSINMTQSLYNISHLSGNLWEKV